MKKGFDNDKYIKIQSKKIKERFKLFDKLYLEIGGKLFDDYHASRVLPGFDFCSYITVTCCRCINRRCCTFDICPA